MRLSADGTNHTQARAYCVRGPSEPTHGVMIQGTGRKAARQANHQNRVMVVIEGHCTIAYMPVVMQRDTHTHTYSVRETRKHQTRSHNVNEGETSAMAKALVTETHSSGHETKRLARSFQQ